MRDQRPARESLARLFIEITEAVGFAHRQGLIHRDLKPANILIDRDGHVHVADFGLAVHKSTQWALAGDVSGTPIYMSPEQIRGETHRLDGRTDLWSLGVILYELLTGARPFQAERRSELFERIQTATPRPPRRLDPQIPPELERICLKCLEKRRSDRYRSADELIDDLRHWLEPREPSASRSVPPVRIVPKGLRSFDARDADFFLDLLPGPRDREGLPESIRFWKARIEQTDPGETFSVGVIYGPSGCGKSSLVKAGLLPRLTRDVLPVYVEATPEETESRLLRKLANHIPDMAAGESLSDVMRRLREEDGRKVLIVLDQFEQWLHARRDDRPEPLIDALRQCDGTRLQCIVLVRDDFWMALTRFLRELEIEWHEGRNSRAVDLFPARHAEEVLTKFGRAFGTLPDDELTSAQQQFITQSVASLAEDGKVVCVRLALFAEMTKDKPWTPSSLKAVGGAAGVGVLFLEETFSSPAAPPEYRHHQAAAREVFKALLPETATDIKGHTRSYDELLQVSGYAHRPRDFERLINILDRDLRLVTPAEGKDEGGRMKDEGGRMKDEGGRMKDEGGRMKDEAEPSAFSSFILPPSSFFQLTHDYLVPSLREWLTRKQKETRRGRAELRLAERASQWNAKPENRFLPRWWEDLDIRIVTKRTFWSEPQRRMMRRSGRFHGLRAAIGLFMVVLATSAGLMVRDRMIEKQNDNHSAGLVAALMQAEIANVPGIIAEINDYRQWTDPRLRAEHAQASDGSAEKLRTSLALLPVDETQVDYLHERLLASSPYELAVLIASLREHRAKLKESLWAKLVDKSSPRGARLRAACALAAYDSDSERWHASRDDVAAMLVTVNLADIGLWKEALRPIHATLLDPLTAIFRDASRSPLERSLATAVLADYAAGDAEHLASLVSEADAEQFAMLFPVLSQHGKKAVSQLESIIDQVPTPKWNDPPLNPSWPMADPADVRAIEAAQGLVAERFAICQTMPLEQFQIVAANLTKSGYRPTRFRPFVAYGNMLVAATWTRDGADWRIEPGTTTTGIRDTASQLRSESYIPEDVAGYMMAASDSPRYTGLWVKTASDNAEAKAYVGVNSETNRELGERLTEQGFSRAASVTLVDADGQNRHCAVWSKRSRPQPDYEDFPRPASQDLSPARELERAVHMISAGYRPADITAHGGTDSALSHDLVWHRPRVGSQQSVESGRRRASAAIALLRLGLSNELLEALRVDDDPEVLTQFVHRSRDRGVTAAELLQCLDQIDEVRQANSGEDRQIQDRVAFGILLALGEFRPDDLSDGERFRLVSRLTDWYAHDPSSTIHGATGWLLRNWGLEKQAKRIDQIPVDYSPDREWYTLEIKVMPGDGGAEQSFYFTFVVFRPGEYAIGSLSDELGRLDNETRHIVRITRPFAILDREITRAEGAAHGLTVSGNEQTSRTPNHPMGGPSWYDAVRFCRWLGQQRGLSEEQQPYPDEQTLDPEQHPRDPNPEAKGAPRDWPLRLNCSGFRLPTEAEWEIACRSGMRTAYAFGGDTSLLDRYGWFMNNSNESGHLPRTLRPNLRGLFDIHGNVWEWCHDWYGAYPSNEVDDPVGPAQGSDRVDRGGGWVGQAGGCRSAIRDWGFPSGGSSLMGFRVAVFPSDLESRK